MPRLGLVLLLVPFLEFYVLVEVGARIGAFNAVLLVILFAMAGVWLARTQGMGTLARIQQSMAQGVLPADEMLDGLFLLLAGILMVFPGFVSDVFGVLLLLPPVRRLAAHLLRRHMNASMQADRAGGQSVHVRTWYFGPGGARRSETFGGAGPMFGPGRGNPDGLGGPGASAGPDDLNGPDGAHGGGPRPYGPDHGGGGMGSGQDARQEPRRTVIIDCEPVEPSSPADGTDPSGPSGQSGQPGGTPGSTPGSPSGSPDAR